MSTSSQTAAVNALLEALQQLGWVRRRLPADRLVSAIATTDSLPVGSGTLSCLATGFASHLTRQGRELIQAARSLGYELYACPPRHWGRAVEAHALVRWYLSHHSWRDARRRLLAVVSSNLGRRHRYLPDWPTILEQIVSIVRRRGWYLLIAEGTTMADQLRTAARVASVPVMDLRVSEHPAPLAEWLRTQLSSLADIPLVNPTANHLVLAVSSPVGNSSGQTKLDVPDRDLLSLLLADLVMLLRVRSGGRIARALPARLDDHRFPRGSVWLRIPLPQEQHVSGSTVDAWLQRGAVGWYLQQRPWSAPQLARCRQNRPSCRSAEPVTVQLAAPMPASDSYQADNWPWLTHCTRGDGLSFGPSSLAELCDAWSTGTHSGQGPLVALANICRQGKLYANDRLTRGRVRCVCFSAVPTPTLVARRKFQPHLGRWDWEPFGVMIQRQAMVALGGRPVIYGKPRDYDRLAPGDRPFFQAEGANGQWREEREWRLCSDLDLRRLPLNSVRLFVHRKSQALAMACISPWPVFWLEED